MNDLEKRRIKRMEFQANLCLLGSVLCIAAAIVVFFYIASLGFFDTFLN